MQHQQPHAQQTYGKSLRILVQQHLPHREIGRTGVSVQAPSSTNKDMLKVVTVVQQIMTELSEAGQKKTK
jgi:hypothetical protein